MMTFLYVDDVKEVSKFMEEALGCEAVFEPSWAKVFKASEGGFIGIVDQSEGSVKSRYNGGTLISLTVENVDEHYDRIKKYGVEALTEIKTFDDIGVRSFFFKGPENYDFEIQMFTKPEIRRLFETAY